MPNWCQNRVHVEGTPERIQELLEFVSCENPIKTTAWFELSYFEKSVGYDNDYHKFVEERHNAKPLPFSLNSIVPQPENIFTGNLGKEEREQCLREGRPNWYDWNIQNWGTKWDVSAEISEIYEGEIEISFDSAWSPPIVVIKRLAELFPDLCITHTYAEIGCMYAGMIVYEGGTMTEERSDDILISENEDDWEITSPYYAVYFGSYS